MELLPDVALVTVLGCLPLADLLRCRLVSRRWRDLAMHPGAWRHRNIPGRCLRLSPPCCNRLTLTKDSFCRDSFLAASTACRALSLHVLLRGVVGDDVNLGMAALVIRHQASLGRLKALHISFPEQVTGQSGLFDLCSVILRLEGVRRLTVKDVKSTVGFAQALSAHPHWGVVGPSSLKGLKYEGDPQQLGKLGRLPLFESLLKVHAPTLEKLIVSVVDPWSSSLDRLFMDCNLLREVSCPLVVGIERLLQCRSLSVLTINVIGTKTEAFSGNEAAGQRVGECAVFGARSLLRAATQLREVTLDYNFNYGILGADLVKALGESGVSEVTSLEVNVEDEDETYEIWEPLVDTIPKLPHLKTLHIGGTVEVEKLKEFRSGPTLTSFTVYLVPACLCCYNYDVIEMLRWNTRIQFNVKSWYECDDGYDEDGGCSEQCSKISHNLADLTFEKAILDFKHVPSVKNTAEQE